MMPTFINPSELAIGDGTNLRDEHEHALDQVQWPGGGRVLPPESEQRHARNALAELVEREARASVRQLEEASPIGSDARLYVE